MRGVNWKEAQGVVMRIVMAVDPATVTLSLTDSAMLLGVSERTLVNWAQDGEIPGEGALRPVNALELTTVAKLLRKMGTWADWQAEEFRRRADLLEKMRNGGREKRDVDLEASG